MKGVSFSSFVALVLLLSLAGLLTPSPGQAQELLSNPGFEDGTTGWISYPSTTIFDIVGPPLVHSGLKAASLTKDHTKTGYALIYQEVAITAGQYYILSGWVIWNDEWLSNVKLRLKWLDGYGGTQIGNTIEVAAPDRSANWQSLTTGPVAAPSGAAVARVECYTYVNTPDPATPAYFDDLSFTESPAPQPDLVKLNEFLPAPRYVDWNGDGNTNSNDEWVELYNSGPTTISLSGWKIEDAAGHSYGLCAGSIAPGEFLVCYHNFSLNNGGHTIRLVDDGNN
ncbi:MAG: hypothetical protein DRP11_04450, partial [Candidatus Aenigmatarchaeota archaeon]